VEETFCNGIIHFKKFHTQKIKTNSLSFGISLLRAKKKARKTIPGLKYTKSSWFCRDNQCQIGLKMLNRALQRWKGDAKY
jgi:hypothetical protein